MPHEDFNGSQPVTLWTSRVSLMFLHYFICGHRLWPQEINTAGKGAQGPEVWNEPSHAVAVCWYPPTLIDVCRCGVIGICHPLPRPPLSKLNVYKAETIQK